MSIDARIEAVDMYTVGGIPQPTSGRLALIDRPPRRPRDTPGCAGVKGLRFQESPPRVGELTGCDIWGGSDCIYLGEDMLGKRVGYTGIKFVDEVSFNKALDTYKTRRGQK